MSVAASRMPVATVDAIGRYRCEVVAPSVAEVVRCAGGLICDRSLSGWDVRVTSLNSAGPEKALTILGAEACELSDVMSSHTTPLRRFCRSINKHLPAAPRSPCCPA
jgi:hypothetical protein